jgi:hypothetical protein
VAAAALIITACVGLVAIVLVYLTLAQMRLARREAQLIEIGRIVNTLVNVQWEESVQVDPERIAVGQGRCYQLLEDLQTALLVVSEGYLPTTGTLMWNYKGRRRTFPPRICLCAPTRRYGVSSGSFAAGGGGRLGRIRSSVAAR